MSNAAANVVLSARGASKSFGSLRAVHDVSFDVYEGEIFGIAGPNGAGKTTLHKIFKAGIARTFQKEAAFDSLSVTENVRLAAAFGGSGSRRSRASDVREALDALELAEFADRRAGTLPLYAKKRLMLASALVEKPALIMLDEPGAGLNSVELDQFMQLVRRLNAAGLTVIVIEHVLGLLFGISHRLMIMDSGRKIAEGQPEVIARDDAVIEAYLGERGKNAFHALKG